MRGGAGLPAGRLVQRPAPQCAAHPRSANLASTSAPSETWSSRPWRRCGRGVAQASVCMSRPADAAHPSAKPAAAQRQLDVVGLGNLCVDIVLPVPELPPADTEYRRRLLAQLTASPPDRSTWEVGGNCNFMIAASRLGLETGCVGHTGDDIYGRFLKDICQEEGIRAMVAMEEAAATAAAAAAARGAAAPGAQGRPIRGLDQTLLCFVLCDPNSKHAFCSAYDFGPWPLLQGIGSLPPPALAALRSSRAVFTNGFVFDELPLHVVESSIVAARAAGASIFFDPGPRCHTMLSGSRREALDLMLDLSCVVLMTEDEARTVTGHDDPATAAAAVLARPGSKTEWCVVKLGGEGSLLVRRGDGAGQAVTAPALPVDVVDTVGCGDSFASAIVMGYSGKHDVRSTLMLANAVGAATATGRGAGRNVASAAVVGRLLQQAAVQGMPNASDAAEILAASLRGAAVAWAGGAPLAG